MNKDKTINIGTSYAVENCQVCNSKDLESILFLGYLPIANELQPLDEKPQAKVSYPTQLLYCPKCHLVQLGYVIDPKLVFPANFPYTSSTTKALRDNFAELYTDCQSVIKLNKDDLIIDIGSNDGNLLNYFKENHKVLGVTPEDIGKIAIENGIPTIIDFFNKKVAKNINTEYGKAKLITTTNTFAHIPDINDIVEAVLDVLKDDGVFVIENHYLLDFINALQYDTVYHEHLRFYSLHSLQFLLEQHGLELIHVKRIPTHGGSFRAYTARKGTYEVKNTVAKILDEEKAIVTSKENLLKFRDKVILNKLKLLKMLCDIKEKKCKIYTIGAAARASTLLNYVGLSDGIIENVLEIKGSHKINNYMSGTIIPILEESAIFTDQPEYVLFFSWHIAEYVIPKLKEKGYKGKFIIPLPQPRIVE